jgi:hypothetical protein
VVAYRLTETVVSAADCAVYVEPGDVDGFAQALLDLLDDPERRAELGAAGRRRCEKVLDWRPQAENYVGVFDELLGFQSRGPFPDGPTAPDAPTTDKWGNALVDVADDAVLLAFAADRGHSTEDRPVRENG